MDRKPNNTQLAERADRRSSISRHLCHIEFLYDNLIQWLTAFKELQPNTKCKIIQTVVADSWIRSGWSSHRLHWARAMKLSKLPNQSELLQPVQAWRFANILESRLCKEILRPNCREVVDERPAKGPILPVSWWSLCFSQEKRDWTAYSEPR